MKNLIKEEINEIKYLFGYQRGIVISEQPSSEEPIHVESPYLLDKVETAIKITGKINATDEILSNLKGKTLYIYNKPTTCNTASMKNMIGGKEATTDDTVLPFTYTIKNAQINTKESGIGREEVSSVASVIYMELEPSKTSFVDDDLKFAIEPMTLFIAWRKETGWKIRFGGGGRRQPVYNECLEKALNEMLPNGLTTIEKEKTDFGYNPNDDYDSNVA